MDNIEWANVNTFKNKYKLDDEKDENTDTEETIETTLNDSEETQIEFFKNILTLLKPGETVIKAIKRFGSSFKTSRDSNTSLSASQRWCKKKNTNNKTDNVDSELTKKNKESLDKLTGYANHFIDQGFYDIYDETYEKITHKINSIERRKETVFDMFSSDLDSIPASTSGNKTNYIEGIR